LYPLILLLSSDRSRYTLRVPRARLQPLCHGKWYAGVVRKGRF